VNYEEKSLFTKIGVRNTPVTFVSFLDSVRKSFSSKFSEKTCFFELFRKKCTRAGIFSVCNRFSVLRSVGNHTKTLKNFRGRSSSQPKTQSVLGLRFHESRLCAIDSAWNFGLEVAKVSRQNHPGKSWFFWSKKGRGYRTPSKIWTKNESCSNLVMFSVFRLRISRRTRCA
jgi:hypothetical protein